MEKVQYDAEYNVFANARQHSEQPEFINNTCVVEKVDSNVIPDSPDMCNDDIQTDQNAEECDDERTALANLIANLTLDTEENKKILKQLKKANASLTQKLKECKSNLEESNTTRDSFRIALQSKQTKLETYKTLNDHTVVYDKLEHLKAQLQDKNIAISELKKLIENCKGKYVETKFDKPYVVHQPNAQRIPKPSVLGKSTPFSDSLKKKIFSKTKSVSKIRVSEGLSKSVNTNVIKPGMYQIDTMTTQTRAPQLFQTSRNTDPRVSTLQELSHLNFDYINFLSKKDIVIGLPKLKYVKDQLCSSYEVSIAKMSSFKTKAVPSSKGRLNLLHMDLCGPMRVESTNGKNYILFLNKTLHAYFKEEGIEHQTSTPRTPEQNGIVERQNHTLVEASRMMLSASKLHLFF
ncbi:retrovirus-related pol polyprotein from transposon TNT 1-94 [Tanacetum coccineum]